MTIGRIGRPTLAVQRPLVSQSNPMTTSRWNILAATVCLTISFGAYLWATAMMDSIYAFRSPLSANPPRPGKPLSQVTGFPMTLRVVFVLIDGLRYDQSMDPQVMPFLNELRQQAAWTIMHSRPPSYSAPGYTVLFTGSWPELSDGPALNLEYDDLPIWTQDNLFSAARRAGLETAVSGFYWFEKLIPQGDVARAYYTPGEDQQADRAVVDAALPWLRGNKYQFILIHLDQVDYAGHHEGGPLSPAGKAAAALADNLVREIAENLDLTRETLFVGSDHGHILSGGHGGNEQAVLREPFILAGAGVVPGKYADANMVDVAPTLAALLGANIPASTQGRVLNELLDISSSQAAAIREATRLQQAQLLNYYKKAIGADGSSPVLSEEVVSTYQAALTAARQSRLNLERLPRGLAAMVVAVSPLVVLIRRRSHATGIYLLGGLIYLALFNLRYAILDQHSYSLSWVASSDALVLYCLTTTAISLVTSWFITSFFLGSFIKSPGASINAALSLSLIVIYLLALPVGLSYTLNGPLATWYLPDFPTMYLAFISILQIMVVALVGILLGGLAALIAHVRRWVWAHRARIPTE